MFLEGKRNRRADFLVYKLIMDMLQHYEIHHQSQELGFDGSNLAQKRRKEILARTPEINADSIRTQGDDCYYVQSATESSRTYLVDLKVQSCDCPDWPRVWLCKHVTAVAHFFGTGNQVELLAASSPAPRTPAPSPTVELEGSPDVRSDATAASILENVITVSRDFLSDRVPSSPGTVRSLHQVEAHLTAVVRNSRSSGSPLPEKENLPPNQHSWTETARRMGVQRWKRPHPTSPVPPESTAAERISNCNRKQPQLQDTDPYSGGVTSGRNAAPDARSAAQNAEARTRAAVEPSLSQPRKCACKRVGTPEPAPPSLQPPTPAFAASPPGLAHHAWYAPAQPTAYATTSTPVPSQLLHPPLFAYPYPTPAAYPSGMYNPTYWPYHFQPPRS